MPTRFCRYTDDQQEVDDLQNDHELEANSTGSPTHTLYASIWWTDMNNAKSGLQRSTAPTYRIGPFPADELPKFAATPTPIQPCNGEPLGNGVEVSVTDPVRVFGIYDDSAGGWVEL